MDYELPEPMGIYRREETRLAAAEVARHPFGFQCTKPHCQFSVSALDLAAAEYAEATHPCPYFAGVTTIGWSITVTLVEQVWAKLDEDMLALKQPAANTDFVALKARLRAFAEVLAIFMVPHFKTADEIAREALRRYENRMDPEYCTPGLNQRRFEPPPGTPDLREAYRGGVARSSVPKRANATETALSKLTDDTKAQIKLFASNGFPSDVLARTHGVSVAVINAVINA